MEKQQIFANTTALCEGFTKFFLELADSKEGTLYVAISGGNTPVALFNYWVTHHKDHPVWKKIQLYWVDERCVPPDNEESNFYNAKINLLDHIGITRDQVHRIRGEASPNKEVKRYASELQDNLPVVNGHPKFDLVVLGMGDDGHTASIFPNQIALWNEPANCVVGEHPVTGQKRVSLTGRVINHAEYVAFMITGKNKMDIVAGILDEREYMKDRYPAALVHPVSDKLFWFLDSDAAHLIMHE